jgi:hypothetical protein
VFCRFSLCPGCPITHSCSSTSWVLGFFFSGGFFCCCCSFVLFWWDWGLNSGLFTYKADTIVWAIRLVLVALVILEMGGVSQTYCLGWLWTAILWISASQVGRIKGWATGTWPSLVIFFWEGGKRLEFELRASHLQSILLEPQLQSFFYYF